MKVRIKATNEIVEVYKHRERATYVNASDCNTEYPKEKVELIKSK